MTQSENPMRLETLTLQAFEPVISAIHARRIPGAVLGVTRGDGTGKILSAGYAQTVPLQRPISDDTWFDLASLTKVLFTTPAILALHIDGIIDLDSPISSVLMDFRQYDAECWERQVTFRECLSHQSPFPAVEPLYTYGRDPELLRAFILQREWRRVEPVYSDINFILLGLVLERIHGKGIRDMQAGEGFEFSVSPEICAATEACTWRKRIMCGEVHDDNCFALQGSGHAGLFGTARAVLDFAQGLLNGSGFSDSLIELMRAPATENRTLGWERTHSGWSGGRFSSASCIGHTGFTGTGLWVDFEADLAWTLLTNRIHPTRHFDSGIDDLRRNVGELVLGN